MPWGSGGLACNQACTYGLLDGSTAELGRKSSTEGQPPSNRSRNSRGAFSVLISFPDGWIRGLFWKCWTDQSERSVLKLKQLKLNAGLCRTLSNVLQKSRSTGNNFIAAVQEQVGGCMGKQSLNLGADRQAQGEIHIPSQPFTPSFTSLLAILLKKQTLARWYSCCTIPFSESWSMLKM